MIGSAFSLLVLFLYVLLSVVIVAGGLWTVLEIGRVIRLPRVIGRFGAEIVSSFREHRT